MEQEKIIRQATRRLCAAHAQARRLVIARGISAQDHVNKTEAAVSALESLQPNLLPVETSGSMGQHGVDLTRVGSQILLRCLAVIGIF